MRTEESNIEIWLSLIIAALFIGYLGIQKIASFLGADFGVVAEFMLSLTLTLAFGAIVFYWDFSKKICLTFAAGIFAWVSFWPVLDNMAYGGSEFSIQFFSATNPTWYATPLFKWAVLILLALGAGVALFREDE